MQQVCVYYFVFRIYFHKQFCQNFLVFLLMFYFTCLKTFFSQIFPLYLILFVYYLGSVV